MGTVKIRSDRITNTGLIGNFIDVVACGEGVGEGGGSCLIWSLVWLDELRWEMKS